MKIQYPDYSKGFALDKPVPNPARPQWLWRGLYRLLTYPTDATRRKRRWVPRWLYMAALRRHLPLLAATMVRLGIYRQSIMAEFARVFYGDTEK